MHILLPFVLFCFCFIFSFFCFCLSLLIYEVVDFFTIVKQVFTPWCINCEATSKQVEKLAKHFKGLDTLVFGRFDASLNEHPKLQVSIE